MILYSTGAIAELSVDDDETLVLPATASQPIPIATQVVPKYPRHHLTRRAFVKDGDDFSA